MGGEHFCTHCEENISKHKGIYVKLYLDFDPDEKQVINVVCPACREENEDLDKGLTVLEDAAKPVETLKGARKCTFCGERIKKKEKSLRAEFRYNGSELRADVCEKCLTGDDYKVLRGIKPKKANPMFDVTIVCHSVGKCGSSKKPGRDRGINCGNVCVDIEGELYCRRAHPGTVKVYRERWALPPSKREMLKIWKDLAPMMKNFKEGTMLQRNINAIIESKREELQALEEGGSVAMPQAIYKLPETKTWEIRTYVLDQAEENARVTLPFFATPLSIDYADPLLSLKVLVPVEEEE